MCALVLIILTLVLRATGVNVDWVNPYNLFVGAGGQVAMPVTKHVMALVAAWTLFGLGPEPNKQTKLLREVTGRAPVSVQLVSGVVSLVLSGEGRPLSGAGGGRTKFL